MKCAIEEIQNMPKDQISDYKGIHIEPKGECHYEDSIVYNATIEDIDMDVVKAYTKIIGYANHQWSICKRTRAS